MQETIVAQTQFLSEEMRKLLTDQWVSMPNWKWIVLIAALVIGFILRPVAQYSIRKIRAVIHRRQRQNGFLQYSLRLPLENPAGWIFICLLWLAIFDSLDLPPNLDKYLSLFVKIMLTFHVIRLIYFAIEALGDLFSNLASRTNTHLDDQLAPFATKTLKVVVVVLGVLIALQNFGVNVVSLLAGLGLGGLALALAAQDTVANLFGSVTILLDNPFKIGDLIKVGDTEGIVEEIGFRSTRLRTAYNSQVSIPNSIVAKEKVDNLGARHRRRIKQVLGVVYETPTEKITAFCEGLRAMLKKNTNVDQQDILVNLANFGASTLDINVSFHLKVSTSEDEAKDVHEIYVEIIELAGKMGIDFAYPTQTLLMKRANPPVNS